MRYKRVAAVMLLMLAGGGCGGTEEPAGAPTGEPSQAPTGSPAVSGPGFHELTLAWQGEQREYLLDAPDDYDRAEPRPLVLVLHGAPGTAAGIRDSSGAASFAQQHGALVAYPQGYARHWRTDPDTDPQDDVGFLTALVDQLVREWNAAPGEVYVAGHSNGGEMAYRLAAEAAEIFAAVAVVTGHPYPGSSVPAEPVSVIAFVGGSSRYTDDEAGAVEAWRDRLGCDPGQPRTVNPEKEITRVDAGCEDGSEVVEYRLERAGHVWPDIESDGLDANDAIWDFFAAHARAG